MYSKKNKSKSRNKPSSKTPQEENAVFFKSEIINTDETKGLESVTESVNVVENDQSMNDVPKKPKRNKSSKKKEPLPEDIKIKDENANTKDLENLVENIEPTDENIPIAPSIRKKKKKTKKYDENLKDNLDPPDQVILKHTDTSSDREAGTKLERDESELITIEKLSENFDIAQKDDLSCKKKKKKKHRHESEKSDSNDPCTMAFHKLIEPLITSSKNSNYSDSPDIQDTKTETENFIELIPPIIQDKVAKQINSTKDPAKFKNNQRKKPSPQTHIETLEEGNSDKIPQSVSKEDIELFENNDNKTDMKEFNTKQKAVIVKPVQKKRQDISENKSAKTSKDHNKDAVEEDIKMQNANITEKKSHSENTLKVFESISENSQVVETDYCQSINLENKSDSIKINEFADNSKNELEQDLSKNDDDLGFIKVKTGKSKKQRNKNVLESDTCGIIQQKLLETEKNENAQTFDMKHAEKVAGLTCEDLETDKIIIPDFIEYPRSTSQQHIDTNNNTFIQDVTSTEGIILDIPTLTSSPIIQGSGESPEAKTRSDSIIIDLKEIDSQPSSSKENLLCENVKKTEKIDIKSKMIEVNRDMEELKRSIEKSLAGLADIEKSDTEVDKEFETLFLNQAEEQLASNIPKNKIVDTECSFNTTEKKCDFEVAKTSEKTDNIKKNLELNVTENIKTEHKSFDKNNLSSIESLKDSLVSGNKNENTSSVNLQKVGPVCPTRRDKGKNKSKKKGNKETATTISSTTPSGNSETQTASSEKDTEQKCEKSEQKSEVSQEKGKQQALSEEKCTELQQDNICFEPIDNFEDALTSSVDDINQTFENIAKDAIKPLNSLQYQNNPQINIISPAEDSDGEKEQDQNKIKNKQTPISRPKNLLGHPNIPASSNKTDYKKAKSKPPNSIQATVKIKDSVEIDKGTINNSSIDDKRKLLKESDRDDSTYIMKTNEDLIFKYSFRKVFLPNLCHVCKKDLDHRVPCKFCSLVFYCSQKHKNEDWAQHQSLCFAVCTIAHLKEQKHIYADAQNILGHNYRVLRMQTILSCEKILNRKLVPWEQEALLYPRLCSDVKCRKWKQEQLKDCAGCGQLSFCIDHPEHLPPSHQRWCKSYALYQRLVNHHLTKGRLAPPIPTRVLNHYKMPGKINDVLGLIYEEKIDMDDIQYAALTQIATAPTTAAYSYQLHSSKMNSTCANGIKKNSTFTIHTVGADLPFEADSLSKWETFFLHLRSDVQDLLVVMVGPDINSSKLPLDLLANIKLCENCQSNKRRVLFEFHDNTSYHDYYLNDGFVTPDIVCAFNSNIYRSSTYNIETWPSTINSILKQRVPFVITSYSIEELRRDLGKIREWARVDFNIVSEIKYNPFSSVRPDRNFITDHEIPLLFKNYCFCILCGTL